MGFNKGAFGEFNQQAQFDEDKRLLWMGDHHAPISVDTSELIYMGHYVAKKIPSLMLQIYNCLLYTSDAADE